MAGRVLVTGGSGVLGRGVLPLLRGRGHRVDAPSRTALDLLDGAEVDAAVAGATAVLHLATRIPAPERMGAPGAWDENDRLRRDATRLLAGAVARHAVAVLVLPSVTFVYGDGPADEAAPVVEVPPALRSALDGERATLALNAAGGRGVVLRLGLLYGPGTWSDGPGPGRNATLHADDAAEALALALDAPGGVDDVADPGRVPTDRFTRATGWRARRRAAAGVS